MTTTQKFKLWKQIRIGTGLETPRDFIVAIQREGMVIGYDNTIQMLSDSDQLMLPKNPGLIPLTNPSLEELDLHHKDTPWHVVFDTGISQGLLPCPHEAAVQLRIQYPDQPVGEELIAAMEPICGPTNFEDVFAIGNKNGTKYLLHANFDNPGLYGPKQRFVFQLPPEV